MDTPGMDKWDETFKRHEIIESFPEENGIAREIDYLFIKMPFIMTDRDLVQESKVWKEYKGNPQNFLNVYKSTTNPKYPEKKKPIRADMLIGGIYVKEVNPNQSLIYLINNFDLKITTGKDVVDSAAPDRAKNFVKNLVKYIEKN